MIIPLLSYNYLPVAVYDANVRFPQDFRAYLALYSGTEKPASPNDSVLVPRKSCFDISPGVTATVFGDDKVPCPQKRLLPSESMVCAANYTIDSSDIDLYQVRSTTSV